MKDVCYLVLKKTGVVRMVKKPPALDKGEVAVKVNVSISDSVFAAPFAECDMHVPDEAVEKPRPKVDPVL